MPKNGMETSTAIDPSGSVSPSSAEYPYCPEPATGASAALSTVGAPGMQGPCTNASGTAYPWLGHGASSRATNAKCCRSALSNEAGRITRPAELCQAVHTSQPVVSSTNTHFSMNVGDNWWSEFMKHT